VRRLPPAAASSIGALFLNQALDPVSTIEAYKILRPPVRARWTRPAAGQSTYKEAL